MNRLTVIPLLLFVVLTIKAQTPQGFNYQAIIRDGSGVPIADKDLSLKITLQDVSQNELYAETHSTQTSKQGIISITIGNGTKIGANTFSSIPWMNGDVFVKIEIDLGGGGGYVQMGNPTKLMAVPYALYANNTKEISSQPNASDDEPIFVVKNKEGKVVFAVYQSGVRVYVDDSAKEKSGKGGFAVGGLSGQSKVDPIEYFRITPDSARIFVNENSTKGGKGGFAVGGLSGQSKATTKDLMYIGTDSARIYIDGAAAKGGKGGFAVGGLSGQSKGGAYDLLKVTIDSTRIYINDSTNTTKGGKGGFAVGGLSGQSKSGKNEFMRISRDSSRIYIDDSTTPKGGKGGFAVGGLSNLSKGSKLNFFNISTDTKGVINPSVNRVLWYPLRNAFLVGRVYIAAPDSVGENSFSAGYESKAKGNYSQTLGYMNIAKGDYATAIGYNAQAIGNTSFSFGSTTSAIGTQSFAFGYNSRAEGDWSIAMGFNARAGYKAFAVGHNATATGLKSVALGSSNVASGETSIAIGHAAYSTENSTVAIGRNAHAQGVHSMALGISGDGGTEYTSANASFSFAIGRFAVTNGNYSTAIGYQVKSDTYYGFAIGRWNLGGGNSSAWVGTDPLLEIGNGNSSTARSNALTVYKNGNVNVSGSATIEGELSSSGSLDLPITNTSIGMTLGSTHHTVLVDVTGVDIYLPSAATCKGRVYVVKYVNSSAGTVYVRTSNGEKIDGATTYSIGTPWQKIVVQSNGVNWFIIN